MRGDVWDGNGSGSGLSGAKPTGSYPFFLQHRWQLKIRTIPNENPLKPIVYRTRFTVSNHVG